MIWGYSPPILGNLHIYSTDIWLYKHNYTVLYGIIGQRLVCVYIYILYTVSWSTWIIETIDA